MSEKLVNVGRENPPSFWSCRMFIFSVTQITRALLLITRKGTNENYHFIIRLMLQHYDIDGSARITCVTKTAGTWVSEGVDVLTCEQRLSLGDDKFVYSVNFQVLFSAWTDKMTRRSNKFCSRSYRLKCPIDLLPRPASALRCVPIVIQIPPTTLFQRLRGITGIPARWRVMGTVIRCVKPRALRRDCSSRLY